MLKGDRPAFPSPHFTGKEYWGMNIRDYFAGKAVQGILCDKGLFHSGDTQYIKELATLSYIIADAMIKAREEDV